MWQYLFVAVFLFYFFNQVLSNALTKYFYVPSQHWQDKVKNVMDYPKPIYLKVGHKLSSYRRRLVLASAHPSYYNNFNNNKIKIHPEDCENKDDYFLSAMSHRGIEDPNRKILYGFFHPYANNGGGGERVLWQAIQATLLAQDNSIVVVYTVNEEEPAKILQKAVEKFGISCDGDRVVFIYLRKYAKLIDNGYWKHFTLLGQLFGSLMLSLEAAYNLSPDIWIDTIGLPGGYGMVSTILKIPILAYVHYPVLQQDMFNKLKFKSVVDFVKIRSVDDIKHCFKLGYWTALYYLYAYLGSKVDITLTNGTWTFNHMQKIWSWNKWSQGVIEILYPPCNTDGSGKGDFGLTVERQNKMIYIAQFRPEKRHDLILEEYKKFLAVKQPVKDIPRIVFLGSCRSDDDTETLNQIKHLVDELELSAYVDFIVDCSYAEILGQLSQVKFGLNSMWNEHFGIGVVEYLHHGVIPIVHASAGPLLDIVLNADLTAAKTWKSDSGFFFKSATDPNYNEQDGYPELHELLNKLFIEEPELVSKENLKHMRDVGIDLVGSRFSNKTFNKQWMQHARQLCELEKFYRESRKNNVDQVH